MSIKKIFSLFVPLLFSIATKAQQSIIGKKFETQYQYMCAKMQGGGCTMITNCILDFQKETVIVSFPYKEECWLHEKYTIDTSKIEKTTIYKWTKRENKIYIKGLKDLEEFILKEDKLLIWKNGRKMEFSPKK